MIQNLTEGRKVSIEIAKQLSEAGTYIYWRPEDLPEEEQYAITYEDVDGGNNV